jgi:hypothetical protein
MRLTALAGSQERLMNGDKNTVCWSYSYSGRTKQLIQPCHQLTEQEKGVYIWDLRPLRESSSSNFITMLRIQSPPYSCDSNTV